MILEKTRRGAIFNVNVIAISRIVLSSGVADDMIIRPALDRELAVDRKP